jgi:deoxyribonuclease-4
LDRCEKLGAEYLVIHPGAWSPDSTFEAGIKRLASALDEAFSKVPGSSMVLIENMAGGGRRVAGPAKEIAAMLSLIKTQQRVGVCFDTCHALAAGYDISTEKGVKETLADYDKEIGLDRIKVFHVNDSKGALGSHRDMHQNLGEGHVGVKGFRALFEQFPYQDRPLILETPKEPMPNADLKNLETLRSCLPKAALV